MSKKNNSTSKSNILILKKNIEELRREKELTQQELADIAGTTQERVSKVLSSSDSESECFTIQQLISIAKCLNVSIDDLLGLEASGSIKSEKTFADVYNALFALDDLIPLDIHHISDPDATGLGIFPEDIPMIPCIIVRDERFEKFMSEWDTVKSKLNIEDAGLAQELYALWKTRRIESGGTEPLN
ncbi:helix-turn-helix transcriptional regulator [Dorea ammoniilytica]|uniref:Helix-turn-helix transcriptional regulator n=1 Tax=Dorea ammoniilytica TaxID=2981788 RepID=A0ABT2S7R1_9FIRM|nr:helix-turn-helix transcriptional regulator [Dorea ammoniilytica]MCU6700629.1 helix-turn-helix transcriptional regulator [Dorea ammoniilytica]SCH96416.1 Helix-turn-helix [uncultured Eubacterium sp.]